MTSIITRRSLLRSLLAAPAVVAASNIMPVRAIELLTQDEMVEWIPHHDVFLRITAGSYVLPKEAVENLGGIKFDEILEWSNNPFCCRNYYYYTNPLNTVTSNVTELPPPGTAVIPYTI